VASPAAPSLRGKKRDEHRLAMTITHVLGAGVPLAFLLVILLVSGRQPVVLLVLPLFPFMGRAIYLDTAQLNWSIMGSPALGLAEVTALATVVAWLVVRQFRPSAVRLRRLAPEAIVCAAILVWIGIGVAQSLASGYRLQEVVRTAMGFAYPVLGYFLWVDILRRFAREEILQLVRFLALSSLPFLVLYCLQELGYRVYPYTPNSSYPGGLARDFATLTPFVFLAYAYVLAWPERRLWWGLAAGCTTMALLLTYTRWIVVTVAACLCLAVVAHAFDRRSIASRFSAASSALIAGAGAVLAVVALSPAAWNLVTTRLSTVTYIQTEANAESRVSFLSDALALLRTRGELALGAGFLPPYRWAEHGLTSMANRQMGDIMWPSVALAMGVAGLVGFAGLLVIACARAARMAFMGQQANRPIGLFMLIMLVFVAASTLGSGSLLTIGTVAGLYFGLLTVLMDGAWASAATPAAMPKLSEEAADGAP
jgi:hypothetical protein